MNWPAMSAFQHACRELRQTLGLALPMIVGHVGQNLMGVADSVMIGRVDKVPLAASAFAGSLFGIMFIVSIGVLSSVSVRTAMAFGAKRTHQCGEILRHGFAIAIGFALIFLTALWFAIDHLDLFGQPPEVIAEAPPYLWIITWSLLPVLVYQVLKQFYEAVSRPWLPMVIVMAGVLLNIFLNWVLIYGNLGAPAMGLTGAGLATLIVRCLLLVALVAHLLTASSMKEFLPERWRAKLDSFKLRDLLHLGVPVGAQLLFEGGIFTAAAVMMGWLGTVQLAAHQIAISCISTSFMVPLGLGLATSVRMGQAVGSGNTINLRAIAFGSLGAATIFMALIGVIIAFGGPLIASGFIKDPVVISAAAGLLVVAALFQIFDGGQVVALGALRGLADVRIPTIITFVGYWVIGVPAAWLLGFQLKLGGNGIWSGLLVGLGFCAVFLAVRLWRQTSVQPQ